MTWYNLKGLDFLPFPLRKSVERCHNEARFLSNLGSSPLPSGSASVLVNSSLDVVNPAFPRLLWIAYPSQVSLRVEFRFPSFSAHAGRREVVAPTACAGPPMPGYRELRTFAPRLAWNIEGGNWLSGLRFRGWLTNDPAFICAAR